MNEGTAERERSFYNKLYSSVDVREIRGDFKVPGVDDLRGKRVCCRNQDSGDGLLHVRSAKSVVC